MRPDQPATVPPAAAAAAERSASQIVSDPDRLAALQSLAILDTVPEPGFDDVVRLASRLCAAPVALVSFVAADRQWFKARTNIPDCETDLDRSVCKFALAEPDLFVIPDLAADPRTADNPLVTGPPGIRFYAGAPLRLAEGAVAVGALCVIDTVPRPSGLTAEQADDLRALARQVVLLLSTRRDRIEAETALRDSDIRARLAQEAGRIGTFEVDVASGSMRVSEELARIYGTTVQNPCLPARFEALIVLEDRVLASTAASRQDGSAVLDVEYRIRRADDAAVRWIARRASFERDETGRVTRMFGTVQDVTEQRAVRDELASTGEQLRLAADGTRIGIFDYDLVAGDLKWDRRVRELFGVAPDADVTYAGAFLAAVHPEDRDDADAAVRAAIDPAGNGSFDIEYRVRPLDGGTERWIAARGKTVVRDGRTVRFVGTVLDVTERRQAEERLRGAEERYRLAGRATNDAIWDWDLSSNHVLWNDALNAVYAYAPEEIEPTGEWWLGQIHPSDAQRVARDIHAVIDGAGTTWSDEYRFRRADGSYADVIDRGYVIRDRTGRATRMIGAMLDITARKTADARNAALVELADRLRTATTSAEAVGVAAEVLVRTLAVSRAGFSRIDLKRDLFEVERDFAAPGVKSMQGRHKVSTFAATIVRLRDGDALVMRDVEAAGWLGGDRAGYRAIGVRAQIKVPLIDRGELVGVLYAHHLSARDWTSAEVAFAKGVADRTYAALGKLYAEADQRVLNEELSHRLKNTLAMVLSIANQTLRAVPEREPVDVFEKRIHALSSAHDVLLRQSWIAAPVRDVVREVMAGVGHAERIDLDGPDVSLGSRATLSLSLLLHELATNAMKYGALSAPAGRIALSWRLEGDGEDADLVLDWDERGGPPPVEPATSGRRGFGSRLIRLGLAGTGGVDLRYPPSGFQATMRAPLTQLQRS